MRKICLFALVVSFLCLNISSCKKDDQWKEIGKDSTGKSWVSLVKIENEHREGWSSKSLNKPEVMNSYGDSAYTLQVHFVVNCNEKLITPKDYVYKNKNDSVVYSRSAFPYRAIDITKGTEEDRIMQAICAMK